MTLRIAVTGAAGLVGQNLVPRLKARGFTDIVAIDKHPANTAILRRLHPDIRVIEANLAIDDGWQETVAACDVVVVCHAQIGGLDPAAFEQNNVVATRRLIDAVEANKRTYVVHLSSSVVESEAVDWYTESKEQQERIVVQSGLSHVVLRPTLMFGWFDRKHIGWLARFMRRVPVFPIPGSGRYLRQPLYVGDLCDIIMSCIDKRPNNAGYNISGQEKIDYIDLMRGVRKACRAHSAIIPIPYGLFWGLLWTYGLFDRDPPFTTKQLEALVTPDVFEVIDWPGIFGVKATPLLGALEQTFQDPKYSRIVLEF
ncbi:MAG TPA: NAD(P)-dependent oxidoreductase [Pseudolabrys sp.]|jgi:nucleoside-diphosphate-sugar epimerase